MGNEDVNVWLKDLKDTSYVVDSIANQLSKIRNDCNNFAISNEIKPYVFEREGKLVKLFSRILYLKLYIDSKFTPSEDLAEFGSIELWLNVVNVGASKASVIRNEISDTTDLLQFGESDLESFCDRCGILTEEKRRFVKATRNLRIYTKRWLEDGREPKEDYPDFNLSWNSYDVTPTPRSPTHLTRGEGDRRSVSDSGASDSGIGSNVSQNSLPTTTPPPSPGLFGVSSPVNVAAAVRGGGNYSSGGGKRPHGLRGITPPATPSYVTAPSGGGNSTMTSSGAKSANKSPSTPPPSLKWGTQASASAVGVTQMTRSKSHESNLQRRVTPVSVGVISQLPTSSSSTSVIDQPPLPPPPSAVNHNNTSGGRHCSGGGHDSVAATTPITTSGGAFNLPVTSSSFGNSHDYSSAYGSADVSPKSPSNVSSPPFASDTLSVPVPKSPRGTAPRMDHKIRHRFRRMWQPSMDNCQHCTKLIGLSGERCTECKIQVHKACKDLIGDNCGLTPGQMRQIYDYFINLSNGPTPYKRSPSASYGLNSDGSLMSSSYSIGHLSAYGPDSASSSSCNSSAPSTPAPGYPQPSPSVHSSLKPTFTFPDASLQIEGSLPFIHVDESSDSNELRMSQSSGDATIHGSHEGSVVGLTSDNTLLPVDQDNQDISNSVDSTDSNQSQGHQTHKLKRHIWSTLTIRGASSNSWREWTIPFEELQFSKPDSLLGRGRFGEVHRAYWHQDVAVKILHMDHIELDRQLETFKDEVSTFRNTRHENLVLFVGCCMNPPQLGIVMNLCKGHTLYTCIHTRRDRLDMNKLISIAIQISQGMSYLHTKKIVHKDLRTKNVFIENNKAVITDFGLFSVRRLCRAQPSATEIKCLHVPENWLCYLAPELIRTLKISHTIDEIEEPTFTETTDVFAFGTVWYELLTYEFPYKRQPTEAVVWQCGRGIKPALNNLPYAKEIKDILMLCWSYKSSDRPNFSQLSKTFEKLPRKRLERSPSQPVHLSRSAESVF